MSAKGNFLEEGLFLRDSKSEEISPEIRLEFMSSYDVVIVDPSGTVNLAARMSADALKEVWIVICLTKDSI